MEHREDKGEHDQSMKATPPSFTIVITPHGSNMLVLSRPCKMLQRGKTRFNFFFFEVQATLLLNHNTVTYKNMNEKRWGS
jgi:hypothetical protein